MKLNINAIEKATKDTNLNTSLSSSNTFSIDKIAPNPHQPRFNEDVEDLKASILESGLLQPIIITKLSDNTLICIGGHRRLKACKELNHKFIKATIIKTTPAQLQSLAIVENLQREDLTALELALAVDNAINSGYYSSSKELALSLGKSQSWISKCLSVSKLEPTILEDIQKEKAKIGLEILVDLQRIKNDIRQCELYFRYKDGSINQSDIRDAIAFEKNIKKSIQPTFKTTNKNLKLNFEWEHLKDDKKANFEIELLDLIQRYKKDNNV